jgi:histidine triad (HIT) family protein
MPDTSGDEVKRTECPFCAIVRGDDSSVEIIDESPTWIAFFPLAPATPAHTLIVPRQHVENYWLLSDRLASNLAVAAIRVGEAIRQALEPEGMNLLTSAGEAAEQSVLHVHLHVVPRWSGDAIGPIWPLGKPVDSRTTQVAADKVKAVLRG